ncbi:MAG: hypothetical protein OEW00_04980, partial [candidate division Zixibacteria bacterium]|nr:hypothetical protein [candidate division Zixibacteria bacterium]
MPPVGNNIIARPAGAAVWLPVSVFIIGFVVLLLLILIVNDGHVVYTLDDAYVHLALAENIANGHYGVNAGEYSAPSSSILWPFLLAPFAKLPVAQYVPLMVNLLATIGVLLLYSHLLLLAFREAAGAGYGLKIGLVTALLIPATNLWGLLYMGMEHTLQLFLAVLTVIGLVRECRDSTVPWWLLVAIIAGPLIRYENLALSAPALGYLFLRRHFRPAVIGAVGVVLTLGAYSLFLNSLELGWLPTSVISKSRPVSSGGSVAALISNFKSNLRLAQGALLAVGFFLSALRAASRRPAPSERLLAAWGACAILLHLVVGNFGWYSRYEAYIWATALFTLTYIYRRGLLRIAGGLPGHRLAIILCLFVGITARPYIGGMLTTRVASNNIYQQQYQMHRFVTEYYRAPVAVNDIGWVSYANDNYVLDLWGLGSQQALESRRNHEGPQWITALANKHDIHLAMIYDTWLPEIPAGWITLGELRLGRRKITP